MDAMEMTAEQAMAVLKYSHDHQHFLGKDSLILSMMIVMGITKGIRIVDFVDSVIFY